MKMRKILILIISVVIIAVGIVGTMMFLNNRAIKAEIKESKRKILFSSNEYFKTLYFYNSDLNESVQKLDLIEMKERSEFLIYAVEVREKEIDEANWCNTKNVIYNTDCNLFKEDMKSFFKSFKDSGEIILAFLDNPHQTSKNYEKINKDFEEKYTEYERKTKKFIEKDYK